MGRRQERKQETRERLIAAAWRLFGERGVVSVRTLEIARAAGVAHGSFFVHFPTREDLIVHLINRFAEQVVGEVDRLARSGASIVSVLRAHVDGLRAGEGFYTWLIRETHLLPPPARAALIGVQSAVAHHLEEVLRRAEGESPLGPLPLPLFFNGWLGFLHHHLLNADLFAPGDSLLERRGVLLVAQYLRLVRIHAR
jgi:AcrR family transcriptional regulator